MFFISRSSGEQLDYYSYITNEEETPEGDNDDDNGSDDESTGMTSAPGVVEDPDLVVTISRFKYTFIVFLTLWLKMG